MARELISDVYQRVVMGGSGQWPPIFYVEKSNNIFSSLLASFFYPRVYDLALLRDPRDLIGSALRYHNQSRPGDFAEFATDFESAVYRLNRQLTALDNALAYKQGFAMLVRYDDLLYRRQETMRKIFEFIGAPLSASDVDEVIRRADADLAQYGSQHITSGVPSESDRDIWMRGLRSDQVALCNSVFGWFTSKYFAGH